MRYRIVLSMVLLILPIHASRYISLNLGPTFQYTRYEQGCLPKQSGPMAGFDLDLRFKKRCWPTTYLGLRGLWDIPHICSKNGLFIDSNEYQVNAHFGYSFDSCCRYSITPFTGLDFIHLSHQIEHDIIRHKYFNLNIPIGVEFTHNVSECFNWGIKTYYDIDVWTVAKVSTPCLCDTEDCKIRLKRGHRFQIEAPLKFQLREDKCVAIELTWMPLFTWQKFNSERLCCDDSCSKDNCCIIGTSNPEALNIPELKQWHLGSVFTFGIRF